MKKYLRIIFGMVLAAALLCTTAFAVEARWSNVASIGPSISANDGCYLSVVNGLSGTTKIDCTLILYEKGWFGSYTEVARTSGVYYGPSHEFAGYYDIKSGTTYKLTTQATVTRNGVDEYVEYSFEKKC